MMWSKNAINNKSKCVFVMRDFILELVDFLMQHGLKPFPSNGFNSF